MQIGTRTVSTGLVWGAGVLAGLFLLVVTLFGVINGYNQHAVQMETQLSNQYLANQNELSKYVSQFYETVGVAKLKSDKMDQILLDAVKGRYEGKTQANGEMFSAMVEAYPDLKGLDIWDKIVDLIRSGRESYANKQDKLLDMLRAYDTWRNEHLVRKAVLGMMGVPTNSLVARVGDHRWTRAEALDKMYQIVLTSQAIDAYNSGKMDPLLPPPTTP